MKNPEFDVDIIQPKHVALLREVAAGHKHWRNGITALYTRKLVEDDGLHAVKVTGKGRFALRGIFPGAVVAVSTDHKLPFLHGAVGVVESIDTRQTDANGWDEYGYVIERARMVASATVRFADRSGEWLFYNPESLVGFPRLKAEINEYWRNVC
jgi:hypothetical protein